MNSYEHLSVRLDNSPENLADDLSGRATRFVARCQEM